MAVKILVPLDGSQQTESALRQAAPIIGTMSGPQVTLLTVVDPSFTDIPEHVREGLDITDEHEIFESGTQIREAFDRALDILASAKVEVHTKVLQGKPYETIVAEAAQHDIVIMHQLQPKQLAEKLRGSKTERIARNCACHVLLMREDRPAVL